MNMKTIVIIAIVVFGIGLGFSLHVSAEENLIPNWIKNIAGFWVNDQVSDAEFIDALQFLIDDGILVVGETSVSQTVTSQNNDESESSVTEQEVLRVYTKQANTFYVTVDERGANEDCKKFSNCFTPSRIWIHPTDTIKFTNIGQIQHRLSSADRYLEPDSQLFYNQILEEGESFEYQFNQVQTYYVTCLNHPDMRLIIKVE